MSGTDRAAADVDEDPVGLQEFVADAQGVRVSKRACAAKRRCSPSSLAASDSTPCAALQEMPSLRALTRFHVDAHRPGADAELGAAPGQVGRVGAGDQGLGRDAAGVDACAAEQLALDQRDGHAQRRSTGRQAAGRPARRRRRSHRTGESYGARQISDEKAAPDRDAIFEQRNRQSRPPVAATSRLRASKPPTVPPLLNGDRNSWESESDERSN